MNWIYRINPLLPKYKISGSNIAFYVAGFACILMFIQFFYIGIYVKRNAIEKSKEIARHTAKEAAQSVEIYFRDAFILTQTYSRAFLVYKKDSIPRSTVYKLLYGALAQSENLLDIWTRWEKNAYDNNDSHYINEGVHNALGSFGITYYFDGSEIKTEIAAPDDYNWDYYTIPKMLQKPVILDPYYYQYHGNPKNFFLATLAYPIIENNEYLGVVGIDVDMNELQSRFSKNNVDYDGYISLLSNSGIIVTHKFPQHIEKNISEFTTEEIIPITKLIKSEKEFSTESYSSFLGENVVRYFYPVAIKNMAAPWYVMIEMPQRKILEETESINRFSMLLLIAFLLLLFYLIFNIIDRKVKEKRLLEKINQLEEAKLRLAEYQNLLEITVKERTEELQTSNEELYYKNETILQNNVELTQTLHNLKETQLKLVQVEKMASLGTLTAGVAHEINNPLNFLMGAQNGLVNYFNEHGSANKEMTDFLLNSILMGIERISGIVKGLTHFSRSNEQLDEDCDIHQIIDNCLIMLHNKIKYKAEIEKDYFNAPILIKGNVGKLHQAFLNVLDNAIQAIEEKGIIKIQTLIEANIAQITIEDNGIGLEKKYLSKVTDPFFTTKDPGKGTGLGLSITYSIIKAHKGNLKFQSEINKGMQVVLTLPIK